MQPITAPIKLEESSQNVANLQAALLLLLPAIGFTDFKIPAAELAAQNALDDTRTATELVQEKFRDNYDTSVLVDELTAKLINGLLAKVFTVNGKLTDTNGQGLSNHVILISEFDIDQTVEVGAASTNADGTFTFSFLYEAKLQDGDSNTNPDLLFRVRGSFGQFALVLALTRNANAVFVIENGVETAVPRLAPSEKAPIVLMNCPQEIEVRIVVQTTQTNFTEFEKLLIQLQPFMRQISLADLKEDDENFQISFLSKDSGIDKTTIEIMQNALFDQRDSRGLPAWAFFGLARLPLAMSEWPAKSVEEFTAILEPLQPSNPTDNVSAIAEALIAYAKDRLHDANVTDLKASVGHVLTPVLGTDAIHNDFFNFYARHEGEIQDFWKGLSQNTAFTQIVPKIQLSLQLSQLTLGNVGLIQSLQDRGITDTKELVTISNQEWQNLAMLHPEGIPAHIVADTLSERATIYANELQTLVEIAFPTEVIKKSAASAGVVKFLDLNPDFDFTKTPVETYLLAKGEAALQGITNKDVVTNEIRQTQRLYAITASASDTQTLASMGFGSAFQLAKMPFSEFVQSGKLTAQTAALYHTKATAITEAAASTYMMLRDYSMTNQVLALGNFDNQLETIPNWQNLFGQVETCECEHCRSVYSPAAYFVDLLHILLGQHDGKARKELFRRRPDLKHTKLSCEHTDTLIPYIDLVNEILETYVAQSHIGDDDAAIHAKKFTNDTSGFIADELAANPQHPNSQADADKAYQVVSEATYPLSLPFDLPLETARQFLVAQNSSRYELMQTFGDPISDATVAESLGLSEREFSILAGKKQTIIAEQSVETEWNITKDFFGYLSTDMPVVPNALGEILKRVREFLSRTGIAYTDLIDLVDSQFLNPKRTIVLALDVQQQETPEKTKLWEVAHACDLTFTRLCHEDQSALTDAELALFNRFIRLWKKVGCTIEELDLMLSALDTEFTAPLLHDLAGLWQLKQSWNLSAEQAAALVSTIPTQSDNSLYVRLFQNKAILQLDDKFGLEPARTELVNDSESIHDHQAAILAAFRISEQDLNEIAQVSGLDLAAANTLTLANLSLIYRFKLIAKINRLSIHDLFLLMPLAPNQPLTSITALTKNQLFFDNIKSNGFTASAIAYLFTNLVEPGSTLPPKLEVIQKSATDLREGLAKITQNTSPPNGIVTADFLKTQLGTLLDEKDISKLISILDGSNVQADPDQPLPAISTKPVGKSDFTFLQNLPVLKEYKDIVTNYLPDAHSIINAQTAADRFVLFWNALSAKLIPQLKDTFAQQHLIAQFKTDADLVAFAYPDLSESVLNIEVDLAVTFGEFFGAYSQLFKFLWLVNKLKLSAKELTYFQQNGAAFDNFHWFDFGPNQLNSWLRLADYTTLRNSLLTSNVSLISVFETAQTTGGDVVKAIVEVTGYDAKNVREFVSKRPLSEFATEQPLLTLQRQQTISQTIGVSIAKLGQWSGNTINFTQAQDIKRTLKANYDEAAWIDVSSQVHNQLRNKQRDALVAYLLQKPEIKALGLKEVNNLYAYFLIDLEMDACMKTSRLKQAIASVQLFVQRCVLNLESAVSPLDIDSIQWGWMKLYRVWEANRKVFLYPENWIEPELRDSKSPFFKELESELLQGEVTNESVETAFMNYLYKLDDVARLDICGMYEDKESQELHVFGRTFNNPPQYFYRKLNQKTHEWTAWDKVQVDIQGNDEGANPGVHLIPVVWNRRLYLFWPIFTEKVDKEKQKKYQQYLENKSGQSATDLGNGIGQTKITNPPEVVNITGEFLEIKLAWSEYKQKGWSPKKVTTNYISTNKSLSPEFLGAHLLSDIQVNSKELFTFRFTPSIRNDELVISAIDDFHLEGALNIPSFGYFKFLGCKDKVEVVEILNAITIPEVISGIESNLYQGYANINRGSSSFSLSNITKKPIKIFNTNLAPYKILLSNNHNDGSFNAINSKGYSKFFYQDSQRNYYVEPRQNWYQKSIPGITDKSSTKFSALQSVVRSANINNIAQNIPSLSTVNLSDKLSDTEIRGLFDTGQITANTALQLSSERQASTPAINPDNVYTTVANSVGERYFDYDELAQTKLTFQPFFHAYVCDFIKALNKNGVDGLLTISNQFFDDFSGPEFKFFLPRKSSSLFKMKYQPNEDNVAQPYPKEDIDFSLTGAYSIYNWELFFHIPMLLANRLSKNQKFEEALRWYHFIFNPTTTDSETSTSRYWQVIPLRNTPTQTLKSLLLQLDLKAGDPKRKELEDAIDLWRSNPFNPHLIARMRLIAYQKNVVMKYLDNLISWADNLFRQDTIESINQATQLYILAAELLGKRPEKVPPRTTVVANTYQELVDLAGTDGLNALSNPLVTLETTIPFFNTDTVQSGVGGASAILSSSVPSSYFGLPGNPKLLAYWDTVADRLYKIRHCQNIEGVERQLALFEPPIDPALLIQATARGIDISSVLADLNAPLPHYRFYYIVQKALEICAELKSLGNTLLSVLEKKDNEALSMMRTQHETTLLSLAKTVKQLQIKESQLNKEGLEKTKEVTQHRADYYKLLVESGLNSSEKEHQILSAIAMLFNVSGQFMEIAAAGATPIPDNYIGALATATGGPIGFENIGGGTKSGMALSAFGRSFGILSSISTYSANMAQTNAGYQRRADDWKQQKELAEKELAQIDKQILAATIRESMADQELTNLDQQLDNAHQVEDFYRNKYTQEELYGWMQGELSTIYFQCYQLAYDLAKKAEKTYRFELGFPESNFIQFGIWDSFRKGLMSGERLYLSLKQMEKAYMDQNRREYELTKHISLVQHFPLALLQLKANGSCIIELPEVLFDADYPGQYMRRIKNMSISIPCVVGPYTSINCTLSLLSSSTRLNNTLATENYKRNLDHEDNRFADQFGAIQSIATSHAQNDSGMFELNFRDERYLPFEYSGAISRWKIELPHETNAFDFETLSDVILHLKYTAREGGKLLKKGALGLLASITPSPVLLSVKHHFANEWYQYSQENKGKEVAKLASLSLVVTPEQLPFFARNATLVNKVDDDHISQAFTYPKTGTINFKNVSPVDVDGQTILFTPSTKTDDLLDVFLIIQLQ